MIITLIVDVYAEESNGTVATTNRLIQAMIDKGHKIRLVSSYKGKDTENLTYYATPKRNFYMFNNYIAKNGAALAKADKEIITDAIKGSDLVHIFVPFKMGKMALKIAKELKVPVTTAFHTQPENITSHMGMREVSFVNSYIYKRFKRQFYKHGHFVHCPSEFIKNELVKRKYKGDFRVISNGVSPEFTRIDVQKPEYLQNKFVLFTSGRLSKEKRHSVIIKAMKYSKYSDNIQIIFAGKGPLRDKLQKQGKHLKNPIQFAFYSNKTELAKALNMADLYCHPADIEIEGIACLEGFSVGKTAVMSDDKRTATREFALSENNLFKHGNAKDLAKKIDYWIENSDKRLEYNDKYLEYGKQFAIEKSMIAMEQMFFDAIDYYKELWSIN